jgi:small conductance mechanosensitive channel
MSEKKIVENIKINDSIKMNDSVKINDINNFQNILKSNSINYLIAFIIFIVFYIIARLIKMKYMSYKDHNEIKNKLFFEFIGNILFYIILIIGLIISLLQVGFSLSTILVCLGSLGLAIALSIQTAITQMISGLFILLFDLYNINDIIEINGTKGYVKDFTLFKTTIADLSDIEIIIPNNNFLINPFVNYTKNKTIKHTFIVAVSANNTIDYNILISNLKNKISSTSKYCIDKNGIIVAIDEIGMSGTKITLKVPINSIEMFYADIELKQIVRTVMADDNVLLLDNSYVSSDIGTSNVKYNFS